MENYLDRVAKVLVTADGGCPPCVIGICSRWLDEFGGTPENMADSILKADPHFSESREELIEQLKP